jgi:hypothetical protein
MENTELAVCEDILEINPPAAPEPRSEPGKPFLCRHIFTDGRRCGSPALREQHFCYYHYAHRTPVLANVRRRQPRSGFDLTRLDGLDNRTSIQLAVSEVLGRVADNSIELKRGWLLLYGLQIAGNNLRRAQPAEENPLADSIVEDATHGQLAAPEEGRPLPESLIRQMKNRLETGSPDLSIAQSIL